MCVLVRQSEWQEAMDRLLRVIFAVCHQSPLHHVNLTSAALLSSFSFVWWCVGYCYNQCVFGILHQAININPDVPFTVISPRNHFVFTPLLPSASVGTLECRCIQEPVRSVLGPNGKYLQAKARSIDPVKKIVTCESIDNAVFDYEYDKLVIAVGVKTNTFGITSIAEGRQKGDSGIFFLKQLEHARAIRANIIDSFEKASIPTVTDQEKKKLLSFLVVGGGPTSCEFTAELHGAWFGSWG